MQAFGRGGRPGEERRDERPAARARVGGRMAPGAAGTPPTAGCALPHADPRAARAQRREGVVRDEALPDELPERGPERIRPGARTRLHDLGEEGGAPLGEPIRDLAGERARLVALGRPRSRPRDAARCARAGRARRGHPRPRSPRIRARRRGPGSRADRASRARSRERAAAGSSARARRTRAAAPRAGRSPPRGARCRGAAARSRASRAGSGANTSPSTGPDLLAQTGERVALESPQHLGLTPLAPRPPRIELPGENPPLAREGFEERFETLASQAEARRERRRREGTVGARMAQRQLLEGRLRGLEQRGRQIRRKSNAQRIAIDRRILGRDPSATRLRSRPRRSASPRSTGRARVDSRSPRPRHAACVRAIARRSIRRGGEARGELGVRSGPRPGAGDRGARRRGAPAARA